MTEKKQKRFVIIDGNALIHRAYHALPPLTSADGAMVNAVYGFTSMLIKVLNDLSPDYMAVCFDVAGKTFRDNIYDKYKATRVKAEQSLYDQIPIVHEVVRAFGIPIYTKEGFEADDVIGTLIKKLKARRSKTRIETIIVSGDMDMTQLVGEEVLVYAMRKGMSDFVMYDEKKVKERFGFGHEYVVDYKALRGDQSDNIPGIKGIGEKTATELIVEYGGIDDIYKKIKSSKIQKLIKPSVLKKLIEGEKDARMSKRLSIIKDDVPGIALDLDDCEVRGIDRQAIVDLFQKFGFSSLLKRLPGESGREKSPNTHEKKKNIEIVEAKDSIEDFFAELEKQSFIFAKELMDKNTVNNGRLTGIVFLLGNKTFIIRLNELNKNDSARLFSVFSNIKKTIIGHDLKSMIHALLNERVNMSANLFDVMIASYIINSSTRAHDIASIAFRELGRELPSSLQGNLFGFDIASIADELAIMQELHNKLKDELIKRNNLGLFEKIEMKLIPVLAGMEFNGVRLDTKLLKKLSEEATSDIERLTKLIWKEAGIEFNIASSVQLREVLFDKMQLPLEGIKKGKTGLSTAAPELEKLRGIHPIIKLIEDHRELSKLQNTYLDVLPGLINKNTGRLHTTFNQAVTTTGRLSSSDPNLQNIPIRTEFGKKIRDAFVADEGFELVAADYSQIELRIVASLSEDKKMMKIFEEGKDIHSATAAAIHGVPLEKVTKEMRYSAKEINFGVLYGMGAHGLSWRAGIPRAEAEEFIRKYFEEFAGVKAYVDRTLKFAKETGYVETLFGRRRYIPELGSNNFQVRSAGERMAVNMPIQGTAADLMKLAMIEVDKKIKESGLAKESGDIKIILQVHDELVLEVKSSLSKAAGDLLKRAMETVAKLRVPIEAHMNIGKRWGDLK